MPISKVIKTNHQKKLQRVEKKRTRKKQSTPRVPESTCLRAFQEANEVHCIFCEGRVQEGGGNGLEGIGRRKEGGREEEERCVWSVPGLIPSSCATFEPITAST